MSGRIFLVSLWVFRATDHATGSEVTLTVVSLSVQLYYDYYDFLASSIGMVGVHLCSVERRVNVFL